MNLKNKGGALVFFIVLIIIVLGLVVLFNPNLTGNFGFEKKNKCRIDSCPALINGICDMKTEKGAVMKNLNDILHDCNLIRENVTFIQVKELCETLGGEDITDCKPVFNSCEPGKSCESDTDCGEGECVQSATNPLGSCVCRITGYCALNNACENRVFPSGCRAGLSEQECCENSNYAWCEL